MPDLILGDRWLKQLEVQTLRKVWSSAYEDLVKTLETHSPRLDGHSFESRIQSAVVHAFQDVRRFEAPNGRNFQTFLHSFVVCELVLRLVLGHGGQVVDQELANLQAEAIEVEKPILQIWHASDFSDEAPPILSSAGCYIIVARQRLSAICNKRQAPSEPSAAW